MLKAKKHLIVIAGPTAVGKTAVAIKLAKLFNTVIINADSRQFYKEMKIGTAKPSEDELTEVKHYFINNKSVTELYGAGHFAKEAKDLITKLFNDFDLLFLVGGSGLYIDALLNGVDEFVDVPINVREELNLLYKTKGLNYLLKLLEEKDEHYFKQVDLNNTQRIIRALEVCIHTNKPYSSFLNNGSKSINFNLVKILLNEDRETLYNKINLRVDKMMNDGLLNEVIQLKTYNNLNALKTVGYKELFSYLEGEITLETAIDKIKQHTRNYAKRQLTWFNNRGQYITFNPKDINSIVEFIKLKTANG
ncbi:MAG: tRNA (adenosine(37)-N6)-dimethylallyltransferase MiaA [Bacteroidetes bacterium]|nr:tRNA (adenosine(37)-N6)-dimethylallyltransferase MiaA [Bacteroidota bacterium]